MKHLNARFTLMTVLLACASAVAQAAPAEVSSVETPATPPSLLSEATGADEDGTADDLHAKAHLDIKATGTTQPSGDLGGSNDHLAIGSTPSSAQVSPPHVPEPSSQTALYVLGGAVGLGLVVGRRRTLN